ncbi:MAG: nitroreductase family protein [Bacteroidales bacterium]|jgi:nitroreductase|nr:nitroreductase family protein [Bacteroidales bacterium]
MLTYKEAIKIRRSVRNYENKAIEPGLLLKVSELLKDPEIGPYGNKPRFVLVEKSDAKKNYKVKLGTYGFISNARYFIGGAIEKFEYSEVDYGYSLENIIIELTRLGLGTCWLGGSLNRKDYETLLKLKEDEIIPCITPVGYHAQSKRFLEKIKDKFSDPSQRKPPEELFFENTPVIPLEFNKKYKYNQVLELLRLAPSAMNKQPWRVIKIDNKYHFYIDRKKKESGKSIDLQKVDIGIALCHFKIGVKELSLNGKWHISDPGVGEWEYIISWIAE